MRITNGRMDIASRESLPKESLFRLVCVEGEIRLDDKGNAPGRGVYLAKSSVAVEKARKRHLLLRAFPHCKNEEEILTLLKERL